MMNQIYCYILRNYYSLMPTEKNWKNIERKYAKLLGGKRRIFGGTHDEKPIDVEADGLVVDVKSTHGKDSITIKRQDIEDIRAAGQKRNDLGVVGFQYYQDRNHYIVIHLEDFLKLRSDADNLKNFQ